MAKINEIEEYLSSKAGALSFEIIQYLVNIGNTPDNARKKLSRAKVKKLLNINFQHNAKFYYLEKQWGTPEYWKSLLTAMRISGSVYATALDGISAKGGLIVEANFPIISGAPIKQKKHISSEKVLERLIAIQAVNKVSVEKLGACIQLNPFIIGTGEKNVSARMTVEYIQLLAIKDWLIKLGFASYNKIKIRDFSNQELPQVSTTCWDLVGPSYLLPLVSKTTSNLKPGFMTCDVFIDDIQSTYQIEYLIKKVKALSALSNVAPIMPIVVARSFENGAFHKLKSEGIIAATLENLFGIEIEKAFKGLLLALTHAATIATNDPNLIHDLFNKLGSIEGAAGHLRGDLFEMIVGHLVHVREGYNIDIGEVVREPMSNQTREIDVRGVRGREKIWHCECKSHQPDYLVTLPEVEVWLNKNVPIIYKAEKAKRPEWHNSKFIFEYWTCGDFEKDALAYLCSQKEKIKKYEINWKNGEDVREYARGSQVRSICETLDKHYFKHPMKIL